MKAISQIAAVTAVSSACCTTTAFQTHSSVCHHSKTSSSLFAKKKKGSNGRNIGGSGGKGFGASNKEPKYSIHDKSYGNTPGPSGSSSSSSEFSSSSSTSFFPIEPTTEELHSSMSDFFSTYSDWKPLFRNVMTTSTSSSSNSMASSFLSDAQSELTDTLWGMSTLEQRNPWRLLPGKPTSDSSLATLSSFLDEWQQSLLDIPLDSIVTGDNDLHFLEEGRRTIAVTRFHVLENQNDDEEEEEDWEMELFRTCWSELAHLMSQNENDTGSLVVLPHDVLDNAAATTVGGVGVGEGERLEYVREFVHRKLVQPIQWLGREEDWEIVAMERGSLAVRLLYKLSDIPDLSERDSSGDENIKL